MAEWGIALSAWGNPLAPGIKPEELIRRGQAAVDSARRLGERTPRELGYIDAVALLYEHADSLDQRPRLLAYRDAMTALSRQFPADTEAMIFSALADVIAADPTDKRYTSQLAAGATFERRFAVLPDHPGLAHCDGCREAGWGFDRGCALGQATGSDCCPRRPPRPPGVGRIGGSPSTITIGPSGTNRRRRPIEWCGIGAARRQEERPHPISCLPVPQPGASQS